jgi:hypothetical protein
MKQNVVGPLLTNFNKINMITQSVYRWVTGWTIRVLGFDSWRGLEIFLSITASRTALGTTQPPIQRLPGALSLGVKGRIMNLTPHLHLVPKSSMSGVIPPYIKYAFTVRC